MNTNEFFNNLMNELGVSERRKREERKAKQQTYLMKDENTGYVKIGVSINPQLRERTLQSQKPTISLFATIKGNIERKLHNEYSDKKVRGEWYNLTQKDIESIIEKYSFNRIV